MVVTPTSFRLRFPSLNKSDLFNDDNFISTLILEANTVLDLSYFGVSADLAINYYVADQFFQEVYQDLLGNMATGSSPVIASRKVDGEYEIKYVDGMKYLLNSKDGSVKTQFKEKFEELERRQARISYL